MYRYYVQDGSTTSLYERWFYCDDLGSQLGPVIKAFFASEQYKTGQPIPEDMPKETPWEPDSQRETQDPFDLMNWVKENTGKLKSEVKGCVISKKIFLFASAASSPDLLFFTTLRTNFCALILYRELYRYLILKSIKRTFSYTEKVTKAKLSSLERPMERISFGFCKVQQRSKSKEKPIL